MRQAQRRRAGRRAAGSLLRRSPPYGGRRLDGRSSRTGASWQRSPALPPPLVGAGPATLRSSASLRSTSRACPDGGPRACPDVLPGQPRRVAPTGAPGMCQSRITVLCRRRRGWVDDGFAAGLRRICGRFAPCLRRAVSCGTRSAARTFGCVRLRFRCVSCIRFGIGSDSVVDRFGFVWGGARGGLARDLLRGANVPA